MIRLLISLVLLPMFALSAQGPRFRYSLTDDPNLPSDVRRAIDSAYALNDSVNRCPSRTDTLWAADSRAPIPLRWLDASLRLGCRHGDLPNAVRRRLREDPAALLFYERVVRSLSDASPDARATALLMLSWSANPKYLALLLSVAKEEIPGITPDSDYNAAYNATIALAPFLSTSREARQIVRGAAVHPSSTYARNAGYLSLATANDRWSRMLLRALPRASVDDYTQRRVRRALAHEPCPRSLVFVEWFGIEGQDYSKCELPPDFR